MSDRLKLSTPRAIRMAPAHTFGWLRRSDLDTSTVQAWERPDGTIFAHDPAQGPLLLTRIPGLTWPQLSE